MANWSNPTLTSLYTDFVTEVKNRDVDLALGLDPATTSPTNVPTNAIRWNSANSRWEKYTSGSWGTLTATYALTSLSLTGSITFEGATDDAFETTLTVADPTADRTITLPNVSGTVVTTGDSGTVTSTMIADGTIVNADINASAAIAGTKISPDFGSQNVTTTGTSTAAGFIPSSATVPSNGLYLPAANQLGFSTASTSRLVVDASGNVNIDSGTFYVDAVNNRVGVGETSAQARLHVAANIANSTAITWANSQFSVATPIPGNGTANRATIYFAPYGSDDNYAPSAISCTAGTSGASSLRFFTNVSGNLTGDITAYERLTLDASGNLGLGVVPSANGSIYYRTFELGKAGCGLFVGTSSLSGSELTYFAGNAVLSYNAGPLWSYGNAGGAAAYGIEDGVHKWLTTTTTGTAGAAISFTQAMTLDANGNLSVGITSPSNTAGFGKQVEIAGTLPCITLNQNDAGFTTRKYSLAVNASGDFGIWDNSASAYRMYIDSSGRLLVGATFTASQGCTFQVRSDTGVNAEFLRSADNSGGPYIALTKTRGTAASPTEVSNEDDLGTIEFLGYDGATYRAAARIQAQADGTWTDGGDTTDNPGRLVFSTTADGAASPTEKMRITNSGNVQIGTTSNNAKLEVVAAAAPGGGNFIGRFLNTYSGDVSNAGLYIGKYDNNSTTSQLLIKFSINNDTAGQGQINANGASQAAFGTFSDRRLKENINDLSSQWNSIKSLRPVEFDYIQSEGGGHQIGFIAQDVQAIYPDVVGEREDGMLTLSGMGKNESRLIKALQEAMERIEKLEADVAALKA